MSLLLGALCAVTVSSFVIMHACEAFEEASRFLGRDLAPGVRGATVNAIGSSLPELLTTFLFLVVYHDVDGFSAGIATCAGSAVFNAILIPAFCILGVIGLRANSGDLNTPTFIDIEPITILRDGFFFIIAEIALVYFLRDPVMQWWMGGVFMLLYFGYFAFLMNQENMSVSAEPVEPESFDIEEKKSRKRALLTFDFRQLFFGTQTYSKGRASLVLITAMAVISAACYLLTESVMWASKALTIPPYFTAVILAAAATSVPDTILSVRDATEGYYDDAISNALGSNIFDITIALGLPLLIFGLIEGEVTLATESGTQAAVQELPLLLVLLTTAVLVIFLIGKKVGRKTAWALLGLYAVWLVYVLSRAFELQWFGALRI